MCGCVFRDAASVLSRVSQTSTSPLFHFRLSESGLVSSNHAGRVPFYSCSTNHPSFDFSLMPAWR